MKKAVLFDIDGTILDAKDFVYEARAYALKFHGYELPSEEVVENATGRAIKEFYHMIVPEADAAELAKTHQEFQEKNFHLVKPFPNTKKTLKALKKAGFAIAAVSNRTRESLHRSLKISKLIDYFEIVVSAEDVKNPKPHQDHVFAALNFMEVEPGNAYMVGDTEHDILAGKNAKVKTIGVTYGWLGKNIAKYEPDYLIDKIEELLSIVK